MLDEIDSEVVPAPDGWADVVNLNRPR
jgi:hypothetical protein